MSSALNVKVKNNVTSIAQGDSASSIVLELLDNNMMPIPYLENETATISLISDEGDVWYDSEVKVFDSQIEFSIEDTLKPGLYYTDIRIEIDGSMYVFPKQQYQLRVTKSAAQTMTDIVYNYGVEAVKAAVMLEVGEEIIRPHLEDTINPHNVTKAQVGLGNVSNVKQATKTEFDNHVNDSDVHVSASEKSTWDNKSNITLGESSSTAYRGDRGKIAYDHSQSAHAPTNAQKNSDITKSEIEEKLTGNIDSHTHTVTKSDVGLGNVDNHGKASQSEAEEGTSDSRYMTPLRTKQAIDALAPAGGSGGGGIEVEDLSSHIDVNFDDSFPLITRVYVKRLRGFGYVVDIVAYIDGASENDEIVRLDFDYVRFSTGQLDNLEASISGDAINYTPFGLRVTASGFGTSEDLSAGYIRIKGLVPDFSG